MTTTQLPETAAAAPSKRKITRCATPNCPNVVKDSWEETGTLCAKCAIEGDLYDRPKRWERVFPHVH